MFARMPRYKSEPSISKQKQKELSPLHSNKLVRGSVPILPSIKKRQEISPKLN